MKILLDTHCWLWMQTEPERLRADVRRLLIDPGNELFLSAASSWEIAIKYGLGKLPLPVPPRAYVPERLHRSGVASLAVQHAHALAVAELPKHHNDPFDRLLVAQAQIEGLRLLTVDAEFKPYPIDIIWGAGEPRRPRGR